MNDNDYRKFGLKYIALLVKFIQKKKICLSVKKFKTDMCPNETKNPQNASPIYYTHYHLHGKITIIF